MNSKVLVVGMADSIHLARWLELFEGSNTDFILVPSGPNVLVHPRIEALIRGEKLGISCQIEPRFLSWAGRLTSVLDLFLDNRLRGLMIRRVWIRYDFDVVHVHELQHGGYAALRAFKNDRPEKLILTNWGSDIYWFATKWRHKRKLNKLMKLATHYSAECRRDVHLAVSMGFSGTTLEVVPNSGGFEIGLLTRPKSKTHERKMVLVKGYTGFVGKADIALQAIRDVRFELGPFKIVVFSASIKTIIYCYYLKFRFGLDICALRPGLSHETMLQLFELSRIYVGISRSDGICTSMLEAMAMGAFPIQSSTSCGSEWLRPSTGFLVDWTNPVEIAASLKRAITDDKLVDHAAVLNRTQILKFAERTKIRSTWLKQYENILKSCTK